MRLALDLSKRAWTRERAGLTLIGTWLLNEDRRWRPCMAIVRTGEERSERTFPCIVTMDKAWIWSEEVGDAAQAAQMAFQFAQALRLDEDPRTLGRLAILIADHLGDLLSIPPRPPEKGAVIGEVTVTDSATGKEREVELSDDA